MYPPVQEHLARYLIKPTPETYERLREVVAESPEYDPYSDEFGAAERLLEQGDYKQAVEILRRGIDSHLLTPRAHELTACAYGKLGDIQNEKAEATIAATLLEALLNSGDGSFERPFRVTRVADEYDVLRHFGKTLKSQKVSNDGDIHFDIVTCTDGTEYWFDITMPYQRLTKALQGLRSENKKPWWKFWG
jgi:hypothetical protein